MKRFKTINDRLLAHVTGGMETGYAEKRKPEPPKPGYEANNETGHSEG